MKLSSILGIRGARDKPKDSYGGSAYSFLFGRSTSGKAVNERTAMQTTAVYSCVRILAEAVASLPIHVYRYADNGKERIYDHPLYHLLHDEPNPEMTSFVFRETLMGHLLIFGNAYAQIIRDGNGRVLSLYPLLPDKMEVDRDEHGRLYYIYNRYSDENPNFKDYGRVYLREQDVLHIPGLGFDVHIGVSSRTGAAVSGAVREKLKVAAYCRVSTDDEEQLTSYEAQVSHYTSHIQQNPEWEFAGIYADEATSGVTTRKRTDFNRLIEDCMAGKIDYVITKSVSRFARNTLDTLNYTRQLKEKNIPVFFEKENIISTDSKGELMLTIMASIAQEESRSTSQNVKMGIAFRFQKGQMQINHNRFMGYTKDENKKLVIVPEEAEIIKRIYREYLEGASLLQIGRGLEADGILTAVNKPRWRPESVKKILQNEKYIGDALLQKTYTVDFLSKKRVVNNGIVPQYYVENSHEAIIPRELYMQVQEEIARRANLRTGNGNKRVYSSRYALSSIVFCGECGDIYRRVHWNNRGKKSIVWRCVSRLEEKDSNCKSRTISETDLQDSVVKAINQIITGKDDFMDVLMKNITAVIGDDFDGNIANIEGQLKELQDELIGKANSSEDYDTTVNEIYRLRELKQETLEYNAEQQAKRQRITEMTDFL